MTGWFLTDEELGKKDDDHKPSHKPVLRPGAWSPAPRIPPRKTFKRLLVLIGFAGVVYLFIHNIPTDVAFRGPRRPVYSHEEQPGVLKGSGVANPGKPGAAPPGPPGPGLGKAKGKDGGHNGLAQPSKKDHSGEDKESSEAESEEEEDGGRIKSGEAADRTSKPSATKAGKKSKPTPKEEAAVEETDSGLPDENLSKEPYNGPLRFLNLSSTLYRITTFRGMPDGEKNVLFAAANLKSVASMIPMACQMAAESRSSVHFALMSRNEIDMEELLEMNGVDDSCPVVFHDARPDFAARSSDFRMETAAVRALQHIEVYMHPQVLIIDGTNTEDEPFFAGIVSQARTLQRQVIELPSRAAHKLPYLAKLDSNALSAWSQISFDILIHAAAGTSGSLIRLLKSLSAADFTAVSVPHLTVELPHDVDESTEIYLQQFQWPPAHIPNPMNVRQMSVRRRVITRGMNEEESSVRTIESFWPHNKNAHVLVLSPQAELAPGFLQYCKYTLLEYAYSSTAVLQGVDKRLFGFSLELPTTALDGKLFTPPLATDSPHFDTHSKKPTDTSTPFLWQSPNSNAMLILGNRWVELHGFVSRVLATQSALPKPLPPLLTEKSVSKRCPSWLEHALRLCRARGYWTIYPSAQTAGALSTIHSERYVAPEEYRDRKSKVQDREKGNTLLSAAVFETLPDGGNLPLFADLPILTWEGKVTSVADVNRKAKAYATKWRREVGGCDAPKKDEYGEDEYVIPHKTAKDLFCER